MIDSPTQLHTNQPTTPERVGPALSGDVVDATYSDLTEIHIPTYGNLPPPPPFGGRMPPVAVPRPPRRRLAGTLVALALLVALGIGTLLGANLGALHTTGSGNTITIGAGKAPNVNVSSNTTTLEQSVESVSVAVEPSVVKITSSSGRSQAVGSGDIVSTDGYIVTNDHVVQGYTSFSVTLPNGSNYAANVIGEDPQGDLAVIKIATTGLQPIAIGDSSKVRVGQFSIAIGYPLGLKETATFGIVSAVNRVASEGPDGPASILTGLIQTSAQINPGNSGGALVNMQGQLIGIPTLGESNPETGAAASGIGYAIPSNRVASVVTQIIQHGSVTSTGQGFLGIQGRDVTPALAAADGLSVQSGVLVAGFVNDADGQSRAQAAGLQSGDVIVAVDGIAISGSDDLVTALVTRAPGAKVTLTVVRGSSRLTITATLGTRPTSAQG